MGFLKSNKPLIGIAIFFGVLFLLNAIYSKIKQDKNVSLTAESKHYVLFDSTFSVNSPFPISKDSALENSNPLVTDKALFASYYSDNICINLVMFKYNVPQAAYRSMAEAYLKSEDQKSFLESEILKQDTVIINGKPFLQLTGKRSSTHKREYNDYISKNFIFLVNNSQPNLYFVYFEDNLHTSEMDNVKKKFFSSIAIKVK